MFIAAGGHRPSGHGINVNLICNDKFMRGTQNIWTMGGRSRRTDHTGGPGVLVTCSGGVK